ncbi:CLUMA_CG009369, isoform A [Clunio marinus]|uniref:CLUMA_CG009369, isoform A n=1 Tax=Clunio marinus TaxID=568069 RepID=A0A1J1I6V8_9DIPT|nr:CLUMA_CG009369, isoform A [Clunio marinus]
MNVADCNADVVVYPSMLNTEFIRKKYPDHKFKLMKRIRGGNRIKYFEIRAAVEINKTNQIT